MRHTGERTMTVDEMCDFLKSNFDGEKEVASMDFYGNVVNKNYYIYVK